MFHFHASSEYRLQIPLDANERFARYRAVTADQRTVELRVVSDTCRNSPGWPTLLKRLKLASLVQHPAIRRVLDLETARDPPFVVLEWLEGTSLADDHRRSPCNFSDAIQLVQRLAEGLAETHRLGIVHGHVMPSSIFARADGDWTLDVSGWVAAEPQDASWGTPRLVQPELLNEGEAEFATDVFGLAAVLEWLLRSTPLSNWISPRNLQALLNECRSEDPLARPTASQVAWRLTAFLPPTVSGLSLVSSPRSGTPQEPLAALDQTLVQDTLGAEPSNAPPTPPPRRLGRFELLNELGAGGMGTVYRARDLADGTQVALKVLNQRVAGSPDSCRRFAKEARLLARANNPFLANLLEFNDDGGVHFLAVEFVSGGTLTKVLQDQGRLDERLALTLMADAARGMAVAHQRGIVHRDIKPDNLLLTETGNRYLRSPRDSRSEATPGTAGPYLKLSDFGLARVEHQSESLAITRDGAILGTPWYMSPEQCRGTQVDARSDVYSLGATLFHLLAGRPPFDGDSPVVVINKHCSEPPPPLRQLRPEVSEGTANVVEKCLAKNPDARYANAAELQVELERLLNGEPTSMLLHPATPDTRGADILEFRIACDLDATPAQLWPYVSNTDRINHALGLPAVRFTTRKDPVRGVERFAETRIAGQRIAWQEHPYEWIEGRRMSVLREFSVGPFAWFVSIVELLPRSGGGTRLVHTLKASPRNWLGRWLATWELGRKSPRSLGRVYRQIDAYLTQSQQPRPADDPFGSRAAMSAAGQSRLQQRLERLRAQGVEPQVVETLGQFLQHGSDLEVARIRPVAFAERFQLDPQQVVAACLLGAREGLLVLLWDILCPSCRIPADVQETLANLRDHGNCPACDLRFEIDFANSVELIFRAHPELRAVETRTYCIGGPAFSAHVVSQSRLAPGERFSLELALGEGVYRIRGPQLPFAVDVRVAPLGSVSRWELPLMRPPPSNSIPVLRPGSQVITLFNDTPRDLQVRLERTAGRTLAFTASAAASLAQFRELFPEQVLSPGQIVSVSTITMLLAEVHSATDLYHRLGDGEAFARVRRVLTQVDEAVRRNGGSVVKTIGDGILATFINSVTAARAAMDLLPESPASSPPLRIAIHRGPAMVTTLNDRLDYFGGTVHRLGSVLGEAGAGELLMTDYVATQPEVIALARERELKLDVLPTVTGDEHVIIHRCRRGVRDESQAVADRN